MSFWEPIRPPRWECGTLPNAAPVCGSRSLSAASLRTFALWRVLRSYLAVRSFLLGGARRPHHQWRVPALGSCRSQRAYFIFANCNDLGPIANYFKGNPVARRYRTEDEVHHFGIRKLQSRHCLVPPLALKVSSKTVEQYSCQPCGLSVRRQPQAPRQRRTAHRGIRYATLSRR